MSIPFILLIILLRSEKSTSRLIYLTFLSAIFSLYGIPETINRVFILRSTINGLRETCISELLLILPVVIGRIILLKKFHNHLKENSEK